MASEEETRGELYRDIGEFTFQFSQLEFTIRTVLAGALRLTDGQFDVVTAPYDFRVLCEVTSQILRLARPDTDGLHKRIEKTFNACVKLNNESRVPAAHGTWSVGAGHHSARHVSRQKLKAATYFDQPGSVAAKAAEAQRLMGAIVEGFPEHPRTTTTPPTAQRGAAAKRSQLPAKSKKSKRSRKPRRK